MARFSRHLASISLATMGAGFISTLFFPASTSALLLQGGFEGGLVGGLADWFAVTALFRHPMGVPIPHTALVVKNRNRITEQVVSMLEDDWLSKESILKKLEQIDMTSVVLERLENEIHTVQIGQGIVAASRALLHAVDLNVLVEWLATEIYRYLNELDLNSMVRWLINRCIQNRYDETAVDFAIHKSVVWLQQPEARQKLGSIAIHALSNIELDGFLQFALKSFLNIINEDKLGAILQNLLLSGLHNLSDEDSENRKALITYIRTELKHLETEPKLEMELKKWRSDLLESWDLRSTLFILLNQFKRKILQLIESDAYLNIYIIPLLQKGLAAIRNNPKLMANIEHFLQQQIADFINQNHKKIGNIVRENLDKLDDATLIEMMEDKLGQDLQWIRVNGAVCGFLIGGLIVGVKLLIHM